MQTGDQRPAPDRAPRSAEPEAQPAAGWAPRADAHPAPRSPRARGRAVAIVGIVLAGAVGLLVLGYFIVFLGVSGVLVGSVLALVPLVLVLLAVRWIDRWEPEPRWALWFAFLWGAAVSVAIALLVDAGLQFALATPAETESVRELLSAAVQAPIVEESAKGLGVLLVFLFWRGNFDGPVDGLVYAATIAAGFAFTENILYFATALAEGGGSLGYTFVVRAVFSPFAHVMFTAATGLALGLAARRGAAAVLPNLILGLLAAILLHALWNGALFFVDDVPGYYFLVQVPLFVFAVVVVVVLRRQEARLTLDRLGEYAEAGWLSPGEATMLGTPDGRRRAKAWAASLMPSRKREMRRLIADATHLAFARQRIVSGRGGPGEELEERRLLDAIADDRARLLA